MDTVATLGRMLISLAVVLGFMWLIARRLKRPGKAGSSGLVDVLGRRQLSRTASVAVVRVLDQALIVGITDGQVSLIGETDLAAAERAAEQTGGIRRSPRPTRPQPSRRIAPDGRIVTAAPATASPSASATPAVAVGALAGSGLSGSRLSGSGLSGSGLSGSALSADTWRQAARSLRSLGSRRR